ncbi:uncharacterized membrane protein [[Candida] jaroonii]|uniref:Uncharacterized membrane protein n=1 Tax=[Candida] jaroonii TaxID=467808 RepID=A0ACA9YA07_9ASCO|nr:uncharacterized membrane protein [[Candida] jaroonii]
MRFSEPLAFTSLFPYIYFYVRDFGISPTKEGIVFYTGVLTSVFSIGQFLCSVHWGRLSDKIGRKPVVMIGIVGTSLMMILFGVARNFYVAAFARFMMGCLNGNVGIYRTSLGEMVTDRSQQASAFMVVPMMWNLGIIVGPILSTFFLGPINKEEFKPGGEHWEKITDSPYLMPNLVVAFFLFISLIIGFLFYEETNEKVKGRYDLGLAIGDKITGFIMKLGWRRSSYVPLTPPPESLFDIDSPVPAIRLEDSPQTPRHKSRVPAIDDELMIESTLDPSLDEESMIESTIDEPIDEVMFTPNVIKTIMAYFIVSLENVVFTEFLPVFLAKPVSKDLSFPFQMSGGFGYTSEQIAHITSSTGLIGFTSIVLFPYLDKNFGIKVYQMALFCMTIVIGYLPFIIFLIPQHSHLPWYVSRVVIYATALIYQFSSAIGIPSITFLVHLVSPKQHKGTLNSLALGLGALARFLGPVIWGGLMSYFDGKNLGGVSWFILSAICFLGFVHSFTINYA